MFQTCAISSSEQISQGYHRCLLRGRLVRVLSLQTTSRIFWNNRQKIDRFRGLQIKQFPFKNLPGARKSRWAEGLTAEDMKECLWLRPRPICAVEYFEWSPSRNHGCP